MPHELSEAIGRFARERSRAEAEAGLLKRHAPDDPAARTLYAAAKAGFDGLIEQLLADLAQHHSPDLSPRFRAALQTAADARGAFSAHVAATLRVRLPVGAKFDLLATLEAIPAAIVKAVVDSGIAIWREVHQASAERRRDIATRLEAQRWKPWAEIPAAP